MVREGMKTNRVRIINVIGSPTIRVECVMSLQITNRWLRHTVIVAALFAAGGLLAPMPAQAQGYSYVDCNNPYYYQYCQAYNAWYNQYAAPYSYGYADPYYGYASPYYGYGVPLGVGVGFGFGGFHHHHHFFHGGGFHGGGGGGFHHHR